MEGWRVISSDENNSQKGWTKITRPKACGQHRNNSPKRWMDRELYSRQENNSPKDGELNGRQENNSSKRWTVQK